MSIVPCTSAENCFLPKIQARQRVTPHFCLQARLELVPTRLPSRRDCKTKLCWLMEVWSQKTSKPAMHNQKRMKKLPNNSLVRKQTTVEGLKCSPEKKLSSIEPRCRGKLTTCNKEPCANCKETNTLPRRALFWPQSRVIDVWWCQNNAILTKKASINQEPTHLVSTLFCRSAKATCATSVLATSWNHEAFHCCELELKVQLVFCRTHQNTDVGVSTFH